jgi:hypothetical protein
MIITFVVLLVPVVEVSTTIRRSKIENSLELLERR